MVLNWINQHSCAGGVASASGFILRSANNYKLYLIQENNKIHFP